MGVVFILFFVSLVLFVAKMVFVAFIEDTTNKNDTIKSRKIVGIILICFFSHPACLILSVLSCLNYPVLAFVSLKLPKSGTG